MRQSGMGMLAVKGCDEVADGEEKSGGKIRSMTAMELQRSFSDESERTR